MLRVIIALMLMVGISHAEWDKDIPLSSDNLTDFPTDNQANLDALEDLLSLYPKGITLSYSSASTIVASAGGVVCSNVGGTIRRLRGNTSTTNITFSDLDTGSESSGTYYIYATCDASLTTAAFKISTSSSAPSGITYYKRLGYFTNDGSNNITINSVINDISFPINLLNTWASKSANTIYQADKDGFVTAYLTNSNNNTFMTGYTDSSSSPTTVRAYSSDATGAYGGGVGGGSGTSMSFPVKKGDYYKVTYATADTFSMYFISMGE